MDLKHEDGQMESFRVNEPAALHGKERDLLSEIIKVLKTFTGNNSEVNKRLIFEKALNAVFLIYANAHFYFYKETT